MFDVVSTQMKRRATTDCAIFDLVDSILK